MMVNGCGRVTFVKVPVRVDFVNLPGTLAPESAHSITVQVPERASAPVAEIRHDSVMVAAPVSPISPVAETFRIFCVDTVILHVPASAIAPVAETVQF